MKKYLITALLMLIGLGANAQFSLSYSVGYGSYKMGDMKQLLNSGYSSVRQSMPKGIRIVSNFPGYITHKMDFAYKFKLHEFGLTGSYLTTGGKIAYSDYSGKYIEKLTFNGYRIGAMYRYYFSENKLGACTLSFFGEVSPGITFTKLKYMAALDLYEQNVHQKADDNISTNATGFTVQPLLGSRLSLTRNFSLFASLGYDFEMGAGLSTTNDVYRADWSGFRLNGGATYSF